MNLSFLDIIEALIGFGLLVFVHELGHFLVAKWVGVRVEAFSLGFGPSLKYKRGDTEYRLGCIPLGGYVKMAGEEPEPDKPPAPGDFYSKTVGQRALVFVAGVTMNLIFGFIFFIFAYGVGVPIVPAVVGDVLPGSAAWKAGLQRGDRIVAIDDVSPPIDFEDLTTASILAGESARIPLDVRRGGEKLSIVVEPQYVKELGRKTLGIMPPDTMIVAPEKSVPRKKKEGDYSVAYRAGLEEGDVVAAVQVATRPAPVPVGSPEDVANAMYECGGRPVRLIYRRGRETLTSREITPQQIGKPHILGIHYPSNVIAAVATDSWAQKAGIMEGDEIESIGGKPTRTMSEVAGASMARREGETPVVVLRDGKSVALTVPPLSLKKSDIDRALAFKAGLIVDRVMPGFPAEKVGIEPGDRMVSVNGVELKEPYELSAALRESKGGPVAVTWEHDGRMRTAEVVLDREWALPLSLKSAHEVLRAGVGLSVTLGARKAWQWSVRVYITIVRLFSGQISMGNVNGPLSIAVISYAAATQGIGMLLYFMGVMSINLGIFNLLPIPVLDGGHLFFAMIEKIRGKALHEKVRSAAAYVGLVLILALLVVAFWNDIKLFILG